VSNPAAAQFKRGATRDGGDPYNALDLIRATHKSAAAMLRDYRRHRASATPRDKGKQALRVCHLLAIHGAIKKEIFYPSASRVLGARGDLKGDRVLVDLWAEQEAIDSLVARLEAMPARHELFDYTVDSLSRHATLQFRLEEDDLFPRLKRVKLDLRGLGEQMASRQLELASRRADREVFREGKRVMRG
jgi:hypothetical protein